MIDLNFCISIKIIRVFNFKIEKNTTKFNKKKLKLS